MAEQVLHEDDDLRITLLPGTTGIAVVAFSGVGLKLGGPPQEEFVKTLEGASHSQIFVVDKNRTWYNATAEKILDVLGRELSSYQGVATLGNSMGGFGAVYFAPRLPACRCAISFVPQFSVEPGIVPQETRWQIYRERIDTWRIHHAMEGASDDIPLHIFFGRTAPLDDMQEALFKTHASGRMAIYGMAGAAHNGAGHLKRHGALQPVLDAVIMDGADAGAVHDLLLSKGVEAEVWTPTMLAT